MVNCKRIFIYTNAYTARVMLRCIQYLPVCVNLEVVFLSEIGASDELYTTSIPIYTYDTLSECVEMSTDVLIIYYDCMPKPKVDRVMALAVSQKKPYRFIEGFHNEQISDTGFTHLNPMLTLTPTIMLVSFNNHMQVSCWEVIVNKILKENGINVIQEMSCELKDVLSFLKGCKVLNEVIMDELFSTSQAPCVFVKSVIYRPTEDEKFIKMLSEFKPDMLILIVAQNFKNYTELKNLFKYRYSCTVDFFAMSEFLEMTNEDGIQKSVLNALAIYEENRLAIPLNDTNMFEILSKKLLSKIALPEGVIMI